MKKLITTTIIIGLSLTVAANAVENKVSDKEIKTLLNQTLKMYGQEKEFRKIRTESMKKVIAGQEMMRKKYPTPVVTFEGSSKEEIESSLKRQAKKVRLASRQYINDSYKDLTVEKCSKSKDVYSQTICKAKNENKIIEALDNDSFKELSKIDTKAFCIKQMLTLQLSRYDNDIISDVQKSIMFSDVNKKASKICRKAQYIAATK